MTSVLVLSHGGLARELLEAATKISDSSPDWLRAVCLDWDSSFEDARRVTAAAIAEMDQTEGLLILTDMYGTTPFNVATSFADSEHVQVLSGVNLPMVLRLCCLGSVQMPVAELVSWLEEKGRSSISQCSEQHRRPRIAATGGGPDRSCG